MSDRWGLNLGEKLYVLQTVGLGGVGLLKPFGPQIILKPQMLDMEV